MFLYIMEKTPSKITDVLNQIVKEANDIGIPIASGIHTLKGDYTIIGDDCRIRDAVYREGYVFKDRGANYDLIFPSLTVEGGEVFEMSYRAVNFKNLIGTIPEGFNSSRFITKKLIGKEKRFLASPSCVEGVGVIQFFQNNPFDKAIYIPSNSSCQNIVDGPLKIINNGNIVVVDCSKIFRTYFNNCITFNKDLENSLKYLFVL